VTRSIARTAALTAALAAGLAAAPAARAELFKGIGRDLAAGAVEKIQPVLVAALADAEARGTALEDHIGTVAGGLIDKVDAKGQERLDQVSHILEARMLQAQVVATDVTDHALSSVGQLVHDSLVSAKQLENDTVKDLAATANATLQHASDVLKDRIADVGREVSGAVERADRSLADRIAQADEALGRRLGNVDVIASKQRIAVEQTAVRVAVLIGLVVFTVFVLRSLYRRYAMLTAAPADPTGHPRLHPAAAREPRGAARTWMFARGLGAPLLGHLVVAAAGTAVLLLLYQRLPLGARNEAAALIRSHRTGFSNSLQRFDFTRARFHASQLEYLEPDDPIDRGALTAKAELLRDVFARPTLLGTESGIAALWSALDDAKRMLGPAPDPDLLVVEAMLVWQTGGSRRDERRAASLCARALRIRVGAGGFALAPLARAYVETFVDAPYIDERAGLGRDSYALDDLETVLDHAPALDPAHPLAARIQLLRLMRTVDARSSTAYAEAIERHVELLAAIARRAPASELAAAQARRTDAATRVLDAWTAFDAELAAAPELARDPSVLMVFRLNDALYARAKWFVDHPATDAVAPLLVAPLPHPATRPGAPADPRIRLQMAPPRIVWARRYQRLIDGPARPLFELQESDRFATLEAAAYAFEQAMIELGRAPGAARTAGGDGLRATARRNAAQTAAALGLYVSAPRAAGPRTPFARTLAPQGDEQVEQAMLGRGIRLL
jgi:hypothetical protein